MRFGNGHLFPAAIAADASGNILVTGNFSGTVDFGTGPLTTGGDTDIFVVKFDPSGVAQWSKHFGAVGGQYGRGIAVDPFGDIVVLCAFEGMVDFGGGQLTSIGDLDIGVVKLDSDGNLKWAKSFGGAALQQGLGLALDGVGSIIIDGLSWGTMNFGGMPLTSTGPKGAVITAKLDANGAHLWSRIFQNISNAFAPELWRVAVDGQGNVVFAGAFFGTIDFGAGPLVSAGQRDVFVVKIDAGGSLAWAKRFGDGLDQEGSEAAVDPSGNVLVVGNFNGSLDFGGGAMGSAGNGDIFLVKLDPSGNELWSKRFGDVKSSNMGYSQMVVADTTGDVIATGFLEGNADFGGGFLPGGSAGIGYPYVAKLNGDGTYAWAYTGNNGGMNPSSAAADFGGNVILAGQLTEPSSFAGANLSSAGPSDIYILKLTP